MELYKKHISDLGRIVTGKTPRTSNAENYGGNIPFLTPSDDLSGKFAPQTVKTITEEGLSEVKNCLLPSKSVCVSCIGSDLGKVVITNEPTVTNQQINSIIPTEENDTDFIYYLMTIVGKHLNFLSKTSTAVPIINKSTFADFEIEVPSLENQRRIAKILSSLDNKIEVNRRINDNLEQQAQALFKSWFVDFEPFRGQPFVESELGMIPEGWRVGTLNDLGEIIGGSTPSKANRHYYTDKGIAWLTPKDLSIANFKFTAKGETDITQEGYNSCSTKLMPKGSVLFSSRAPIGYITIAKNEICTNQGFKSVVPKIAGTAYIYYFLKASTKEIENKATGSTFKEASGALMKSLPAIIPPISILDSFENLMEPLFRKQEAMEDESRRLAELRDTLLPRLMSGELSMDGLKGQSAVSPGQHPGAKATSPGQHPGV